MTSSIYRCYLQSINLQVRPADHIQSKFEKHAGEMVCMVQGHCALSACSFCPFKLKGLWVDQSVSSVPSCACLVNNTSLHCQEIAVLSAPCWWGSARVSQPVPMRSRCLLQLPRSTGPPSLHRHVRLLHAQDAATSDIALKSTCSMAADDL